MLPPSDTLPTHPKSSLADSSHDLAAHSPVPKAPLAFGPNELSAPGVQKIVVEHIVKSDDKATPAHSSLRLRAFWKIPRPYSEPDYITWCSHVQLMMKVTTVSDLDKTHKILESLLPPAIRHLGPEAPPSAYLQLLDSAFGTIEDGEELFV